jgi:hypothetical protein
MAERRRALIIAVDEYDHPGLRQLSSPAADAQALGAVLGDPRIGDFEVSVVRNQPAHEIQSHLEDLFLDAKADDVLLVHFSGHGLKGEAGDLFFAARNTRPNRLASTAVPADFVQRCIRTSPSRSIVLLLDCCYGGAFGQGVAVRAAGEAQVLDSFPTGRPGGGRGRAVITASNSVEYAFEGERLSDDSHPTPSPFTAALVHGMSTGEADRDEDGFVSLNELYDYVFDRVREQNPNQTPSRDIEMQGEFYLAKSGRQRLRPAPLPLDLEAAAKDVNAYTRLGAVAELRSRLLSDNLPVATGAREALVEMAASDTQLVAGAARTALGELVLDVAPTSVDLGQVTTGSPSTSRRVALSAPPLARHVRAEASEPWVSVESDEGGETYAISVSPPATGPMSATVTFSGPAGDATVSVSAIGVEATTGTTTNQPERSVPTATGANDLTGPRPGRHLHDSGRPRSTEEKERVTEARLGTVPGVPADQPVSSSAGTPFHPNFAVAPPFGPPFHAPGWDRMMPSSGMPLTEGRAPRWHGDRPHFVTAANIGTGDADTRRSRLHRLPGTLGLRWLSPADRPVLRFLQVLHVVSLVWAALCLLILIIVVADGDTTVAGVISALLLCPSLGLLPAVLVTQLFRKSGDKSRR